MKMQLTLTKIREVFPHFNERPVTEEDFWRACKRLKIVVRQIPLTVNGYYNRRRGRDYIIINSNLAGLPWLFTALHEFTHYLFDSPDESDNFALYSGLCLDKEDFREKRADAFAMIGLLPFPDLLQLHKEDIAVDTWLAHVCASRILVRVDYGL